MIHAPRRSPGGFTLIELLIVVGIIAIIGAIAIPVLLRSRVSANESATLSDIRTVLTAEAAYHSANGGAYGSITCLSAASTCIPNYQGPNFLDANMSTITMVKSGYTRVFVAGTSVAPNSSIGTSSMADFTYQAVPVAPGQTGVRGFAGDSSGRVCATPNGAVPVMTSCTSVSQ